MSNKQNQKTEEIMKPYTTEELSSVLDHVNCGFITIQTFMDHMKDILNEEGQKYVTELSKELGDSIDAINDYV